jgi:phage/plasmid-associated DNA primase
MSEADFDADPHLLNTPAGVVDLRTSALLEHDPKYLMRHMTLKAPDFNALYKCVVEGEPWAKYMPLMWRLLVNTACTPGPDLELSDTPGALRPDQIIINGRWVGYSFSDWMHHQHLLFVQGAPGIGKTQIYEVALILAHTYGIQLHDKFLSKAEEGKRFDIMQLVGKRMGFQDETQQGQSWDETRGSKIAASDTLSGEIKGGRVNVPFPNTTKLTIAGNHLPHFVSGETGGLVSRMLLLEAGGLSYRNREGHQIKRMARRIVEEEGSAVLAWIIDNARREWEDNQSGGHEFARLTAALRLASREYAQEDSLLRQWMVDRNMGEGEGLDLDMIEAMNRFRAYAKDHDDKTSARMKRSAFKAALKKACPSIEFDTRTTGAHPNRAFIRGFGELPIFNDETNVVDLVKEKQARVKEQPGPAPEVVKE